MPSADDPFDLFKSLYPRTLLLFKQNFDWRITGRWMLYSVLVGIAGALGALLFAYLERSLSDLTLLRLVGYHMPSPGGEAQPAGLFDLTDALLPTRRWLLFIVPTLGGLLSGWLVFTFAPEAEGHGTDAVIRSFHHEQGVIRPRVPLIKTLASVLTIGTGGSAGREGPIAQIGAGFGSLLATRLGLSARERRILLISGIAAGISSIFRSPLGGAFFAVEVLYREDMESEALMPAVVAGITGYSVYSSVAGSSSVFTTPEFSFLSPLELIPIVLFALGCAVLGIFYVRFFYGTKRQLFDRLPVPNQLKPALGGLLVGGIAFFFPAVLGSSYGWLQQAINGNLPVTLMAVLALTKILATSLTIGSGGSGGVFAPSLVIGGMLGGLFGIGLNLLFPTLATQPQAYVMIGMGTFFAGAANVPIATTVMISELTGRYTLLVPLIFGGVIAHIVSRNWSLYTEQVPAYDDSPAHRLDLLPDLLNAIPVASVVEHPVAFDTLDPASSLDEMLAHFSRTREVVLPVAARGRPADGASADGAAGEGPTPASAAYSGLVLLSEIQSLFQSNDTLRHLLVARDIEVPFLAVHLDDTLDNVVDTFATSQYPALPVLNAEEQIVGFVRQGQVIREYYQAYLHEKSEAELA